MQGGDMDLRKGSSTLDRQLGSLGIHPRVREGLFGPSSSSIPDQALLPKGRAARHTMSVTSGKTGASLTEEILNHLGLADKSAAWGTLGTLRTFLSFSVDKDVQRLLRAIAGQGVDHNAIVDVLTNRSREQRQLISRAFQERTQQDSGSAEDVAMEILATRTPPQLQECLAVYRHDFKVEAEEDIKCATKGILQDLLLALAKGGRESYSGIIDYNLAEQDVQALKRAEGPSTEQTWVFILTQRNPEHLVRVLHQYQRSTGHELEKTIRDRFHGAAQVALLSLASVILNAALYFADKLHQALQETEPNYQVLIRILISRSETDLLSIRAEFKKKFGKSLYSSLQVRLAWFLTWIPRASPVTSTLHTAEHIHALENS
ncbi:annexin A9 isoform X4 [Phacochoerus africanus]|uniref:annexin A9 isoform X4 n=1 Tax=Phacochoerus africanus TaxID=41426 RepID=UPI001FDA20CD|nr:annexin A9 isoform X4 [Phacochoerus africanus]